MLDRLDRLRHDAVVGRYDQHDDVGRLRATLAHRGERGMARGVEEGDHALGRFHMVRADMLGDAAGFARSDLGPADVVEQRGLAVVDMTHDGDHRRTGDLLAIELGGLGLRLQRGFRVGVLGANRVMAQFLDHQHRGVVVDGLVDGRHDAHLEQRLDHLGTLDGHLLGQVGDQVAVAYHDVAHDRRGRTREAVRAG